MGLLLCTTQVDTAFRVALSFVRKGMGNHQAFAGSESVSGMLNGKYVIGVDVGTIQSKYRCEFISVEYIASLYVIFEAHE
jgi:hypothetical protein